MQSNLRSKLESDVCGETGGEPLEGYRRDDGGETSPGIHVGIIMDGNGRWAASKGMARHGGHKAGARALARIVEAAPGLGVRTITAYAFSVDNWTRPATEVALLMTLLRHYLLTETARFVETGTRLCVIGRRDRLPAGVADAIGQAERATRGGTRFTLRLAIDYSARDAIVAAVRAAMEGGAGVGELTRERFAQLMSGGGTFGDVDLIVRTSGEKRLSDFLLWECAYAELYFTDRLWPDFCAVDLRAAVAEFHGRERRFGGLSAPVAAE